MAKRKTWVRVQCSASIPAQEVLIARLWEAGIDSFEQSDTALIFFVPERDWSAGRKEWVESLLSAASRNGGADAEVSIERIHDRNWNEQWERSIKVLRPTGRIFVRPSWKRIRGSTRGRIVLTIDPKMSFGTGHHETTRICLRFLERYVKRGDTVLDFGTGTGILAIASIKMGARRAVAIDNDEWCIENAGENVRRNGVEKRVLVRKGSSAPAPRVRFDVVIANIDLPTIRASIPRLLGTVRTEGTVILSGLMMTDLAEVLGLLLPQPVEPLLLLDEGEWFGIAARKVGSGFARTRKPRN